MPSWVRFISNLRALILLANAKALPSGDKLSNDNKISFEEYENFANYMKERYRFMQTQYNDILKLYEEVKQKNDNRQTWHPNLSKEQIEELNQKGINKPEGQEYEKYLEEHGLTSESIQVPTKPGEIYGLGQQKKQRNKKTNQKKKMKKQILYKLYQKIQLKK